MKKMVSFVLVLILVLALSIPASAGYEYELLYDGTERLNETVCKNIGFDTLPDLSVKYQVEFRVDVIKDPADMSIPEYAAEFYEKYDYGYSEDNSMDGVLLMLYLTVDGGDLVFHDYAVYCGGTDSGKLNQIAVYLEEDLVQYLNVEAWQGDLSQDNAAFSDAMDCYTAWIDDWFSPGEGSAAEDVQTTTPVGTTETSENFQPQEAVTLERYPQPLDQLSQLYVVDQAGILTKEQCSSLQRKAKQLSESYQCSTYILTVDDFTKYSQDSIEVTAKAIYHDYDLGYGEEKSGALLLLSMADRQYWVLANGYGNTVYTDYASQWIWKQTSDNLKDDDWLGGFSDYLDASEKALQMAADGHPLVYSNSTMARVVGVLISCVLALIIAYIVVTVLTNQMKSVREKVAADRYVASGGAHITNRDDTYTHTTTTRRKIERSSDDSGRGGGHSFRGTTVGRDGFSGHGGKF